MSMMVPVSEYCEYDRVREGGHADALVCSCCCVHLNIIMFADLESHRGSCCCAKATPRIIKLKHCKSKAGNFAMPELLER